MSSRGSHLKKIAITGGIGAGKSSLSKALSDLGYSVFDADRIVSDVVLLPEIQVKLRGLFGDEAYLSQDDGHIEYNRAWIRDQVFADPEKRKKLEAILHPAIFAQFDSICSVLSKIAGGIWVFYEAALIFESSRESSFDAVVSVVTPEQQRRTRLKQSRSLSDETLDAIFAAQVDDHQRRSKSHFVIDNAGVKSDLSGQALELVDHLRQFFHPKTH